MFSEKVEKRINEQINLEMWSANLYLSMSIHFDVHGYHGFATWMMKQYEEEMEHAMKLIKYIIDRGGTPVIGQINVVPTGYGEPLEIFEHALGHEKVVTKSIEELYELAIAEKDYATQQFLMWFIEEQVEEEATASGIVDRIKLAGKFLLSVDKECALRS